MTRVAEWMYPPEHDALVLRALGLVLSGALILAWAALRILDTIEGV